MNFYQYTKCIIMHYFDKLSDNAKEKIFSIMVWLLASCLVVALVLMKHCIGNVWLLISYLVVALVLAILITVRNNLF